MSKLTLSLNGGTCRVIGCTRHAGVFGVCDDHQKDYVIRYFHRSVVQKLCPLERPRCFESDEQWREYIAAWIAASTNKPFESATRIDYCQDCQVGFKREMMKCGRCDHPETVFIYSEKHDGDLIGVSVDPDLRKTRVWEMAVFGASGDVSSAPPEDVLGATLDKIASGREAKKRGPKFKKDRVDAAAVSAEHE